MSTPIYTAEDLATLTDMPDLPEFIEKRTTGVLALSNNVLKLETPLEAAITHRPGPSRAEIFFDYDDNLTLRSMFQGIGHAVSFREEEEGKFIPAQSRYIIEEGHPILWSVGEYDHQTRETRYFGSDVTKEGLSQLIYPHTRGVLKLSDEARIFAYKIASAVTYDQRAQLAEELSSQRMTSRVDRRIVIRELLSNDNNVEHRMGIVEFFKEAATTVPPKPPEYREVSQDLQPILAKLIEPLKALDGDLVSTVCRGIQSIRDLNAGEYLAAAELMGAAMDDPAKVVQVSQILEMPMMLQGMVLKRERTQAPAPAI